MADTQTFKQHAFTTESDQSEGYKRLSRLAVWSIPLGLLSALSMVSPLLWFVPVVAVAFALGGMWVISRSDDTTGRRLALVGLGLAVLFGTWGVSWTISRRALITRQAREHASEWLTTLQKREYLRAHQLSLIYARRVPSNVSLTEHYAEEEEGAEENTSSELNFEMSPDMEQSPFQELNDFKNNGVPKILVEADGDFEFKFVRNVNVLRSGQFTTNINQLFRLTFPEDHEPREMDVRIEMKRTIDKQTAYWQVGELLTNK